MIEVEFHTADGEQRVVENVMDALVVGGKVRWATEDGEQHTLDGGRITTAVSEREFRAAVKVPVTENTEKYLNATMARLKPDEKLVYLCGPGWVDAQTGAITRVRTVMA